MANTDAPQVAFIIGGHPFDARAVNEALDSYDDLAIYPQDLQTFIDEHWGAPTTYDAAVFYNFHGYDDNLTNAVADRIPTVISDLGEAGVGFVALHHGLLTFPDEPAWSAVTGLEDQSFDVHLDQEVTVEVATDDHPITAGLSDWTATDETYDMTDPTGESVTLLSTDHPRSIGVLAWTRQYRDARVFCYQMGHDVATFSTPEFREVLGRGIRWVSG